MDITMVKKYVAKQYFAYVDDTLASYDNDWSHVLPQQLDLCSLIPYAPILINILSFPQYTRTNVSLANFLKKK